MKKIVRTAKTRKGKVVELDNVVETEHGFESYVLGRSGFAVATFVPKKDG